MMANDGHIAKDTLLEPERLAARAIDWDQSDRGLSSGRAAIMLQIRRRIHGRSRNHASITRKTLAPREPSIHGPRTMANAEHDVLAYMGFPAAHRAKLHSTNPIERLNGEIKRRTEVVGIFPNEQAITRLIGAILMEQSEEWAVQRARYMTLETMAPVSDDPIVMLSAVPGA
jgi:hypothetical protein